MKRTSLLAPILAALFGIGLVLHVALPAAGWADVWDLHLASLYQVDFLGGVLIWRYRRHIQRIPWIWPALLGLLLLPLGGYGVAHLYDLGHIPTDPTGPVGLVRTLLFGASGFLLLVSLLSLEASRPALFRTPPARSLERVGDASYALYLSHPIIIGFAAAFVARKMLGMNAALAMMAATFAAAIAFALLWYRLIEAPYLKRFAREKRPARLQGLDGPD